MPSLYLASASPRRRELLAQIGVPFTQLAVAVDESVYSDEAAACYVERVAQAKAQAGWQQLIQLGAADDGWVLAADTSVCLGERILGKPRDKADALAMLTALSGQTHQVRTAVALCHQHCLHQFQVVTQVQFRELQRDELERYWASGEPCDKAGSYAIQGLGAIFVRHLQGSYSAVVGLPLTETAELLRQVGIECWR